MLIKEVLKELEKPQAFGEEGFDIAISYKYPQDVAYKKIRRYLLTQCEWEKDELPEIDEMGVQFVRLVTKEDALEFREAVEDIGYVLTTKKTAHKVWVINVG